MRVGEGRYLVFLLLMAGFWTSFNQIFMTLPEYIRDYVDTTDLVAHSLDVAGRRVVRASDSRPPEPRRSSTTARSSPST